MKMKKKTKKIILTFILFLLGASIYGGVISLVNRYLRDNDMDTPMTKLMLLLLMCFGFYKMWRWLCRKLDAYSKEE